MEPADRSSNSKRFGISALSVIAATLVTLAVQPLFAGRAPLFFLTVAVMVSAMYGLGPGLLATALSVGSVLLLFRQTFEFILLRTSLELFALICVGISVVMGRLYRANAALIETKRALEIANKKLSERSQVLSQSNEELRRFAYSIAHDLNTPVQSIGALTDLLVQRNAATLDESSKECAALIANKATRIQAMIKGLLDYAAAADRSDAEATADAGIAVQKALQDLDSLIAKTGAQITVQAGLPAVAAAESLLVQVFSNLISNAIKYTQRGRVAHIHVSATVQENDAVFCVKDNGIGVDMKYAGRIFGMFQRLHGEEYEGSGIGLALCKTIVESCRGRIWLESKPGDGSAFYFAVPKDSAPPAKSPHQPRSVTTGV